MCNTHLDRCETIYKVGAAATGLPTTHRTTLRPHDMFSGRQGKQVDALIHTFTHLPLPQLRQLQRHMWVKNVVLISLKKMDKKSMKPVKAFLGDNWEEQDDTIAFYDQLKRWGLRLRKRSLVSRRLFSFNQTMRVEKQDMCKCILGDICTGS